MTMIILVIKFKLSKIIYKSVLGDRANLYDIIDTFLCQKSTLFKFRIFFNSQFYLTFFNN